MTGLDSALSPLRFLDRSAAVFPGKVAVIDGNRRLSYADLAAHATRLAHAVRASGVRPGERVAYLAANSAEMLAAHFAIPLAGNVLVAINTRLAAPEIQYICDHSEAKMLIADGAHLQRIQLDPDDFRTVNEIVEMPDADGADPHSWAATPYSVLLDRGSDEQLPWQVADETTTITINYTSGTTGRPKGVMYTHRGAYLNALNQVVHNGFSADTRYLWTLPMFHCNGWCHPWAVTASGGTHVSLRAVRADAMWQAIDGHGVTHLSGAPIVLSTLTSATEAHQLRHGLTITTAGAPPSPATIEAVRSLGATVKHVYGLTETYGPYSICEMQSDWHALGSEALSVRLARQGVGMLCSEDMRVVRTTSAPGEPLVDVRPNGTEMGEIVMRGNIVMKGYYREPELTEKAFAGGWFHSGDLGVRHPDGYVQLFDRAKDVIISGGENISSVEVEQALMSHPAVLDVAVVGVPDPTWGERPKAFVVTTPHAEVKPTELIEHVKTRLAGYKAPRDIEIVAELPKTSTGKTLKTTLRTNEWGDAAAKIRG
ncbi:MULTISPECIES: AMP-binding protein [unclassified Mycolicibacterium]|uniref:AMP-binding protein n=1 Tax=unclassified Mycolicibacterium TaxID=2636767 RepID=UPI0012DDB183|nr:MULTISPECIES: AMP-binding protein [unclassified Mycolicibacterium]MUL82567.1 AMP-binding protein [Mycolicibacterium sp. CBMA 329]MUL88902.1 AMP-binding protein [Mycolicibacterium sp. CBMA 331]MUL97471.1 AMP-binding protein [Mycolicibacterium sp. CBMA 334]MUM26805.1 AMP-binding protein [Mycolicibacterium sp. CBMA 295]MUM38418.1 AMP-binding protein [Mycolicibacterium sp. CBMA 247]